jgi:branched-subunit amino acid ABC-type transport system permease component
MDRTEKRWGDFSPEQQKAIIVAAAIEVVLTATALRDLRRRSADQVRGPKAAWALSFVVQPFGPLAYYGFGRIGR